MTNTETGHCDESPARSTLPAKPGAARRARRRLFRTRLACLLTGGHQWMRLHEGDGSLAFIDCRKCGFRP